MSKYSEKRKAFKSRTKQAVQEREKGGGKFSCIDFSRVDGVSFFKPVAKEKNLIDIIPFFTTQDWIRKMKGFNNTSLGIEKGDMLYKFEVPQHTKVGAEERVFLCLKFALGKSCPICNEREALSKADDVDEDLIKSLWPKWRVLYNIIDKNEKDKVKAKKVWDSPYHSFEKFFLEEADEGEQGIVIFADPEDGKTIKFKGREKSFPGGKCVEAGSISFMDRKRGYSEEDIQNSISFDKYLKIPTYEEVEKCYFGILEREKAEEETSSKEKGEKKKKKKKDK